MSDEKDNSISIPAEKAYYLLRTQVLKDIEHEVMAWAQKRLWLVTLVVVVVGFFGASALITQTISARLDPELRRASEQITRTQIEAENTANIIHKAQGVVDAATKKVSSYSKQLQDLQETSDKLSQQLSALRTQAKGEATNIRASAELQVEAMKAQFSELEKLVEALAAESKRATQDLENYKRDIAKLNEVAEAKSQEFSENSKYSISILYGDSKKDTAEKLKVVLAKNGYKVSFQSSKELKNIANASPETFSTNAIFVGEEARSIVKNLIALSKDSVDLNDFVQLGPVISGSQKEGRWIQVDKNTIAILLP